MQFDKFTNALQSAVQQAQSLAVGRDHTAIEPIHLLSILLGDESNINIYEQAGANIATLKAEVQKSLDSQAVIGTPTGEVNLSQNSVKVLNLAERHAQKAGDQFLAIDWVLVALAETGDTAKLLSKAGVNEPKLRQVINFIRGGDKVNQQNAEDQRPEQTAVDQSPAHRVRRIDRADQRNQCDPDQPRVMIGRQGPDGQQSAQRHQRRVHGDGVPR